MFFPLWDLTHARARNLHLLPFLSSCFSSCLLNSVCDSCAYVLSLHPSIHAPALRESMQPKSSSLVNAVGCTVLQLSYQLGFVTACETIKPVTWASYTMCQRKHWMILHVYMSPSLNLDRWEHTASDCGWVWIHPMIYIILYHIIFIVTSDWDFTGWQWRLSPFCKGFNFATGAAFLPWTDWVILSAPVVQASMGFQLVAHMIAIWYLTSNWLHAR